MSVKSASVENAMSYLSKTPPPEEGRESIT